MTRVGYRANNALILCDGDINRTSMTLDDSDHASSNQTDSLLDKGKGNKLQDKEIVANSKANFQMAFKCATEICRNLPEI